MSFSFKRFSMYTKISVGITQLVNLDWQIDPNLWQGMQSAMTCYNYLTPMQVTQKRLKE